MSRARPANTQDFSSAGYCSVLGRAQALGYSLQCFAGFMPPAHQPVLLLRHDLDHSLRAALPLAELEAQCDVRSTYFVQVTCDFYNVLGREGRAVIARLVELDHEVGLHYDARRYAAALGSGGPAAAEARLRFDLALLEDLAGQPVVSASQHLPCDTAGFDVRCAVRNEAYEDRFTAGSMAYISDSLLAWRQATPHDLLDRRASFQLLTHPMKWGAPVAGLHDLLQRALREECDALRVHYEEVEGYYAGLLQHRAELDAAFLSRRAGN